MPPLGRLRPDDRSHEVAIAPLQLRVVFALVGQQEIGVAQFVQQALGGKRRRKRGQFVFEGGHATRVIITREHHCLLPAGNHRQHQMVAELRSQKHRVAPQCLCQGFVRCRKGIGLGERGAQLQRHVAVAGVERRDATKNFGSACKVAPFPQEATQRT